LKLLLWDLLLAQPPVSELEQNITGKFNFVVGNLWLKTSS